MRNRRTVWLALPLAALALAAGCGVPDHTDVALDGPAQQRGGTSGTAGVEPKGPADAVNAQELVEFYLRAAAQGPATAAEQLRPFIAPNTAWQPGTELTIAQRESEFGVTSWSDGTFTVDVALQPLGQLTQRGTVTATSRGRETFRFRVVPAAVGRDQPEPAERPRYLIDDPPPGMFLLADALGDDLSVAMYQPVTVYYWDVAGTTLIPDIRYLSRTISFDRRPNAIVDLLLSGPSESLQPAVRPIPAGMSVDGNVFAEKVDGEDGLVVNLRGQAATIEDVRQIAAPLAWSLRAVHSGPIELRIAGVRQLAAKASDYADANVAAVVDRTPERFCIVGGVVRLGCRGDTALPVLSPPDNAGVLAAAIARDRQHAALVKSGPGTKRTLWLGQVTGSGPSYLKTNLSASRMSRPTFMPLARNTPAQGLIVADGKLHRFVTGRPETVSLDVPNLHDITAVTVAADGRRIALAAGGRVYVTSLVFRTNTVSVAAPLRALPSRLQDISGIGWSRPDRVILLGRESGRYALTEMTVDGLFEQTAGALGDLPVSQLVTSPGRSDRGPIMIEADGQAREVNALGNPVALSYEGGPTPTAPPAGPALQPLAPFFLD